MCVYREEQGKYAREGGKVVRNVFSPRVLLYTM